MELCSGGESKQKVVTCTINNAIIIFINAVKAKSRLIREHVTAKAKKFTYLSSIQQQFKYGLPGTEESFPKT